MSAHRLLTTITFDQNQPQSFWHNQTLAMASNEWEIHKDEIELLYVTQNKKLSELEEHMSSKGFRKT
jgi:hypothetical protein